MVYIDGAIAAPARVLGSLLYLWPVQKCAVRKTQFARHAATGVVRSDSTDLFPLTRLTQSLFLNQFAGEVPKGGLAFKKIKGGKPVQARGRVAEHGSGGPARSGWSVQTLGLSLGLDPPVECPSLPHISPHRIPSPHVHAPKRRWPFAAVIAESPSRYARQTWSAV